MTDEELETRSGPHGPMLDLALNWTCGLSPGDALECLDVATWHGFKLTDDGRGIAAMMASCEVHRARMGADFEHPMQSACGLAGSRFMWPENYCHLDWGDGMPALAGVVAEPAVMGGRP